jgi:hypothetical protein
MKKYILILCFFAGTISLFSQISHKEELDKLYNDFIKNRNISNAAISQIEQKPVKCGFVNVNSVKEHFNEFSYEQQQILKPLITRPVLQTSIVSPSGFFRIHYDTSGVNAPVYYTNNDLLHYSQQVLLKMYMDSVAIAADSAYNFEINYLTYPAPPSDDTAGGDTKYDIYLWGLGNFYGDTQFEGTFGPSYMEVNNNFNGFPTPGIYAVRVTVAHEFHHGIQVGNYIYRLEDGWFHEMTSTSMEHFVYPSIHDYYFYMSHYFSNPQRSLASNDLNSGDGYDIAIWNIYLQKKFDYDIIKNQWQLMPQPLRAIEAINKTISEKGSSFSQILNEFGVWVYFTNSRAQQGKYFPEGASYPLITFPISNSLQFPPFATINNFNNPVSNNFFNISIQLPTKVDILVPIITNSDFEAAVVNAASTFNFQYLLYNYYVPGTDTIGNKYYSKLNPPNSPWFNSVILNNTWIGSTEVFNPSADFAFPSPFNYSYPWLYIPVDQNVTGEFNLDIFSISMKLVYSSNVSTIKLDKVKPVIMWNGRDNNNQKLASGVYVYTIKSGNTIKKGKIVIFNE